MAARVRLEASWEKSPQGTTLLHVDLRADNMLSASDRLVVVDWPHAATGAVWIDLMFLLPSLAMPGGPMPWELFDLHPVAASADSERVTAVLARHWPDSLSVNRAAAATQELRTSNGCNVIRECRRWSG